MTTAKCITAEKLKALGRIWAPAAKVAVVSHMNPDGDAVGACAAMSSFLREVLGKKDVTVVLPDAPGEPLSFVSSLIPSIVVGRNDIAAAEKAIGEADAVFVLDLNRLNRTSVLEQAVRRSGARKVLIDHHPGPEEDPFELVFSDVNVSSACELLYQILTAILGGAAALPADCAKALMCGMTTDTNNFANSVFPSTLRMASELIEAGVDRDAVVTSLFQSYRVNRIRLMGYMLDRCLRITPEGAAWMLLTKEIKEMFDFRDGETEGFVNIPLASKDIRLSIFLTEEEDRIRVSVRSKKGTSARQITERFFNGGGHENASGGRLMIPEDIPGIEAVGAYVENALKQSLS